MKDSDLEALIRHLETATARAAALSIARLEASEDPTVLIVLALLGGAPSRSLARAEQVARTTRDRQLVAIGAAHLAGDRERTLQLIREHLVDYPNHPIVAWIVANPAGSPRRSS